MCGGNGFDGPFQAVKYQYVIRRLKNTEVIAIDDEFSPQILISEEIRNAKTISVENLNPCYAICLIKRNHVYHYYMTFDLRTSILFLPEIVRALLKTYLPLPMDTI
jgi:hypothetical protein